MATLNYLPVSFGGTSIQSAQYRTRFHDLNGPVDKRKSVSSIEAAITGKTPGAVRAQPQSETWELWIQLTNTDETDVQAMNTIFVEGLQVYLLCTDGAASPVTWRISCHALSAPRRFPGAKSLFVVALHIADPTWEENTVNTDTQANKTSSPIAMGTAGVMTNAGTRDTEPAVAITANVAKSANSALNDFPFVLRTFWVNRAPFDLVNEPVYLFDQTAAAARIATGTSAGTGAFVNQNSGTSQTLTADPGAGGTTLAMSAVAGFNTNGGLAIIDWVTGSTFGTMEAVYYTGISGNNLTGVVRGVGGTTAQAHAIGKVVRPSGTMPNGDDVRVWFEDQPNYRRDLVAWNSTASDVVINVNAKKVVSRTLVTAMASSSVPAVGAVVNFVEGNAGLDAQGFFACENEIFHYSAKSGDQGVIIDGARGLWGTTAAAHATSALCYFNPKRIVIACGWAKADSPPADLAHRACIQLPGSSNQTQKWGDETDDPLTIYFDRTKSGRPKQWAPGFDRDGNAVSPLMSLSKSDTIITFKDDVSGDGSPPYNCMEIALPQGVKKSDTFAIQNSWSSAVEVLNLELWSRDDSGTLKLLDQLQSGAAPANRNLAAAIGNTAYAVKLKGRYNPVLGAYANASGTSATVSNTVNDPTTVGTFAQRFTTSKDIRLTGIALRMALVSGVTSQNFIAAIYTEASGHPDTQNASSCLAQSSQVAVTSTTEATYRAAFAPDVLPAGTYWLVVYRAGANVVSLKWINTSGAAAGVYVAGKVLDLTVAPSTWTFQTGVGGSQGFYIEGAYLNDGTAPIETSQPVLGLTGLRTGITASFDKTLITMEPLQTVYVHRNTAFVTNGAAGAMLHVQEAIASATSGDSVALDKWVPANAVLTIDFALKTVSYTEDGVTYPLLRLVAAKPQMLLKPGANTLTITDPSLISPGQVSHVTTWRGKRT